MLCNNCGTENDDNARFCSSCGQPLNKDIKNNNKSTIKRIWIFLTTTNWKEVKEKIKKIWSIILITIIIIGIIYSFLK